MLNAKCILVLVYYLCYLFRMATHSQKIIKIYPLVARTGTNIAKHVRLSMYNLFASFSGMRESNGKIHTHDLFHYTPHGVVQTNCWI